MRRSSRTPILLLATLVALLLTAPGCSSRKKVSGGAEPPPPPSTEDNSGSQTETPPPPSTTPGGSETAAADLRDAFFDFDDASLREDAKAALDGNAKFLEGRSGSNVVIEGHCDERGSVEYNLALGEKRARAAKDYLTAYGINAARITTISYGKERPFDPGHSEEAWAQNRRAHFVTK